MKSVELSNQARVHENCGIPKGASPLWLGFHRGKQPLGTRFSGTESLVCYTFAETVLNENGIRSFDA